MLNAVCTSSLVALFSLATTSPCSTSPEQQGIAALESSGGDVTAKMAAVLSPDAVVVMEQEGEEPIGPEPTTLLLAGAGLVGLAFSARRWRRGVPAGS